MRRVFVYVSGLPLLALLLWLASGREVLTKHTRMVGVPVKDELFGDVNIVQQAVHGPVLGYYIGLDLVIFAAMIALGVVGIVWFVRRRALRKETP